MSAFKNDGTIPYGSLVLTIGSASGGTGGTTYIAEELTLTRSTNTIVRKNEIGEPTGQVSHKSEPDTISCTLQLAAAATKIPQQGWETTIAWGDIDGSGAVDSGDNKVYYVDTVGISRAMGDYVKLPVTLREKLN